jgi:hypothetical protein
VSKKGCEQRDTSGVRCKEPRTIGSVLCVRHKNESLQRQLERLRKKVQSMRSTGTVTGA